MTGLGSYSFGPNQTNVDLSIWTGVKMGVGFAIGVALVTLVLSAVVIIVFRVDVAGFAS